MRFSLSIRGDFAAPYSQPLAYAHPMPQLRNHGKNRKPPISLNKWAWRTALSAERFDEEREGEYAHCAKCPKSLIFVFTHQARSGIRGLTLWSKMNRTHSRCSPRALAAHLPARNAKIMPILIWHGKCNAPGAQRSAPSATRRGVGARRWARGGTSGGSRGKRLAAKGIYGR